MKFVLPAFSALTPEQKNLVVIDLADPERKWWGENLVVKGYGWTGKTVVACHRALRLQKQKKKILFLCFWKVLNSFLATEKLGYENLYLQWFYQSMRLKLEEKLRMQGKVAYQWGFFRLESFLKNVRDGSVKGHFYIAYEKDGVVISENINRQRYYANNQDKDFLLLFFGWYKEVVLGGDFLYDEIYIDEAQDISPEVLASLKVLAPHFSVFADENQRIGKNGEWSSILDIAKIFFPNASVPEDQIEELTINMRTTKEICKCAAEYFLKEDEAVQMINQSKYCRSDPNSTPQEEIISDAIQQKEQVLTWIKLTLNDTSDFAVLCPETPIVDEYYEYLVNKGLSVTKYHSKEDRRDAIDLDKQILVTTYESSKGLEADYVILIITKKKYDEYFSAEDGAVANNILYVLATRAKKKLYILFTFDVE
mgnify:CR=1 FL=1